MGGLHHFRLIFPTLHRYVNDHSAYYNLLLRSHVDITNWIIELLQRTFSNCKANDMAPLLHPLLVCVVGWIIKTA